MKNAPQILFYKSSAVLVVTLTRAKSCEFMNTSLNIKIHSVFILGERLQLISS